MNIFPQTLFEKLGVDEFLVDYKNKIAKIKEKDFEKVCKHFGINNSQCLIMIKEGGWYYVKVESIWDIERIMTKREEKVKCKD